MSSLLAASVGTLVAEKPERARVFDALQIDYCCGGGRSLRDACDRAGLDPETVGKMLDMAASVGPGGAPAESWTDAPLGDLADHIESTHHAYLRRELPRLERHLTKVRRAHGEGAPWVAEAESVFADLKADLEAHMEKEETVVFPWIRARASGLDLSTPDTLGADPIALMEEEHDLAGDALKHLRALSSNYTAPEWACPTFRAMVDGLRDLEADMHQHVHKENNILFPRASALGEEGREIG